MRPKANTNTRRKKLGKHLRRILDGIYHNGSDTDNLIDTMTDLLHSGITVEELESAVRIGEQHYTIEKNSPTTERR